MPYEFSGTTEFGQTFHLSIDDAGVVRDNTGVIACMAIVGREILRLAGRVKELEERALSAVRTIEVAHSKQDISDEAYVRVLSALDPDGSASAQADQMVRDGEDWLFEDGYGNVWRLTRTADPYLPLNIQAERKA